MTDLNIFRKSVFEVEELIYIKPICDLFKISYENQTRRISSDRILSKSSTKKPNKDLFGDNIARVAVSRRGFVRWIQLINPSILQEDLREDFEFFQEKIFDYLYNQVSLEDNEAASLYQRQQKLKRLYSKIGNEIKTVQKELNTIHQQKYLPPPNKKIE